MSETFFSKECTTEFLKSLNQTEEKLSNLLNVSISCFCQVSSISSKNVRVHINLPVDYWDNSLLSQLSHHYLHRQGHSLYLQMYALHSHWGKTLQASGQMCWAEVWAFIRKWNGQISYFREWSGESLKGCSQFWTSSSLLQSVSCYYHMSLLGLNGCDVCTVTVKRSVCKQKKPSKHSGMIMFGEYKPKIVTNISEINV